MILQIARKEFREIRREGKFLATFTILLILLVIAVVKGRNYYVSVQKQHQEAQQTSRNHWDCQKKKNPHSAAHYGMYVFKPKYPLSLVDQGVDKYTGVSVFLEAHKRHESTFKAISDQSALARFGDLTADFVLLYLVPLFIILIGFNCFTREKENGTWKMLLAQGVHPRKLVWGKWLGVLLPLASLLVPVLLLGMLLLATLKNFGEIDYLAIGTVGTVYFLYYAIVVQLTLSVSLWVKKSHTAFLVLLAGWIFCCLIVPKFATTFVEMREPLPSMFEFQKRIAMEKKQGIDGHNPYSRETEKLLRDTLKEHNVKDISELPFNFAGLRMQKGEEVTNKIYDRNYQKLQEQYKKQEKIYDTFAFLSPFLPVRFLSMAFSGTDMHHHWTFTNAAEQYRRLMVKTLNEDLQYNSKHGQKYEAGSDLWKKIPPFSPPTTSVHITGKAHFPKFIVLLVWFCLSLTLMLFLSRRNQTS
ncbi:DUF3526 domain-containing protein [Candidatus Uabimicrobium amorphum]|uniref:ABC-2 type transporter transmembrane domain-containing protein n=1 Tax=Uabimicrobium amorphum TaxID=2596890 RepID=A0A5S9IJP8_UABAM|nr:DUF3526 domain-containing protein [Candidatus Uabimicrobium amorphum]BBM83129.1 hypothetical protein UABAM_01480 [Candidatus Uabimicrobium amorphum]